MVTLSVCPKYRGTLKGFACVLITCLTVDSMVILYIAMLIKSLI